ncbi:hypothetical protein Tco_0868730 [Tanacetum coccineum]
MVIELLLESIITFVPPSEDKAVVGESSLVIDMEIDVASSKGKGKAITSRSEEKEDTGEKKTDADWRHKLAGRASQFLVASCVRSIEARRRIFIEVNNAFIAQCSPRGSLISREASATFIDVCLVRCWSWSLKSIFMLSANATKTDNQVKPSGHLEHGGAEYTGEVFESFSTVQAYGGSEFVIDDMKHDQDINGGYAPPSEDDVITHKYL